MFVFFEKILGDNRKGKLEGRLLFEMKNLLVWNFRKLRYEFNGNIFNEWIIFFSNKY